MIASTTPSGWYATRLRLAFVAQEVRCPVGVEVAGQGALLDLGEGLGDRLAHLERDQASVVVAPATQVCRQGLHRHGPLGERRPPPGLLRRVRPGARRGIDRFELVGHGRSLSLIQSAIAGRYLYGMLLQTWLPSGYMSRVALSASRAIRSACSGGKSRSRAPWMTRSGWSTRARTPWSARVFVSSKASASSRDFV